MWLLFCFLPILYPHKIETLDSKQIEYVYTIPKDNSQYYIVLDGTEQDFTSNTGYVYRLYDIFDNPLGPAYLTIVNNQTDVLKIRIIKYNMQPIGLLRIR